MRRGHPGGGWRTDPPRRFRPRSGGPPHFRPGRGYGMYEQPRFPHPPPGSRGITMAPGRFSAPGPINNHVYDHYERKFRNDHLPHQTNQRHETKYERRHTYQYQKRYDGPNRNPTGTYDSSNFHDDVEIQTQINEMGDIDHRQAPNRPWINPPSFDARNQSVSYKTIRHHEEHRTPALEYDGHRPPSSDHYDGNSRSTIDSSNAFSRSVDDTVDIVRKRLLNRESQPPEVVSQHRNDQSESAETPSSYANVQEQPKKRIQKQRMQHNTTVNCNKIKDKIIHQLFMMDKDRIHKLMDNPNSSSKFEFAINSLVTESQNSYNRHMRSQAEKSLTSNDDFIHNDNNTIYEDTFMRQMQCILDPQDTVLLEDIKPMVLAELSKVLQIDNFDCMHEMQDEQSGYPEMGDEDHYEQYPHDSYYYDTDNYDTLGTFSPTNDNEDYYENQSEGYQQTEQKYDLDVHKRQHEPDANNLFERRRSKKSCDFSQRKTLSPENQHQLKEKLNFDKRKNKDDRANTPIPVFDPNSEQLSEEDDPFADLDNQYHVAVDHNFIADDEIDMRRPIPSFVSTRPKSPVIDNIKSNKHNISDNTPFAIETSGQAIPNIQEEINVQLQDFAKSPLKFSTETKFKIRPRSTLKIEPGISCQASMEKTPENDFKNLLENISVKQEIPSDAKSQGHINKSDTSNSTQESSPSHSRKRSIDERPSHRKEKRKKSESSSENNQKILKDNHFATKSVDKFEPPKTIFNLCFSKKQKDLSNVEDKCYSDKYVKRKKDDISKKSKNCDSKYRIESNAFTSPSNDHFVTSSHSETPIKIEGACKLKPINIFDFEEQPKKMSVHQVSKNTASASIDSKKVGSKITKRHVATQVVGNSSSKEIQTYETRCNSSRFTQTVRKKLITRGAQTDPVTFKLNPKDKMNDMDSFDRMKEIDVEIQVLLNEKFTLYNSLEAKGALPKTVQSLGMAVLNVVPTSGKHEENNVDSMSPDAIVEQFTNNMEELEDIVDEMNCNDQTEDKNTQSENKTDKIESRKENASKIKRKGSMKKKILKRSQRLANKTPNISLLEQIIIDDWPIEDIISLDDLENDSTNESTTDKPKPDTDSSPDKLEKLPLNRMRKKVSKKECYTDLVKDSSNESTTDNPQTTHHSSSDTLKDVQKPHKNRMKKKAKRAKFIENLRSTKQCSVDSKDEPANESNTKKSKPVHSTTDKLKDVPEPHKNPNKKEGTKKTKSNEQTCSKKQSYGETKNESTDEFTTNKSKPVNSTPDKLKDVPHKKCIKKEDTKKAESYLEAFKIRECSVILSRIDLSSYLKSNPDKKGKRKIASLQPIIEEMELPFRDDDVMIIEDRSGIDVNVLNDIQFDMLDISEDIVIGDNCEIKTEKDSNDSGGASVSEEIILDNSQSSIEDKAQPEAALNENVCKIYDYASDENLKRDSVLVTGNGDTALAIECIDKDFLVACQDGNVYHFSNHGQLVNTFRSGSNHPVTCITIVKEKYGTTIYTGSLDSRIRYYDLKTGLEKGPECNVLSPIQAMDRAWDTIFVGTRTGFVLQFECKNNLLIPVSSTKFSEHSILALRAMKEGPRKVLLVASRSEAVTIKDAQTGLLLRTLDGPKMTVYSLLYEDGKIYCGTSSNYIHVFDYSSGGHVGTHESGKGIVCLRCTGGLVLAGCYDGCVYVYREGETKPLAQICGPSVMLLSLAVVGTKIIVAYKDKSIYMWKLPLNLLQEMIL